NMIDIAAGQGVHIDHVQLSKRLGMPVVPIQANKKKGLDALKRELAEAAACGLAANGPPFPEPFEREAAALQEWLGAETPPFLVRRLLLDAGGCTEERFIKRLGLELGERLQLARQRLASAGCGVPAVEARARYAWLRQILTGCVQRPSQRPVAWTDRLD